MADQSAHAMEPLDPLDQLGNLDYVAREVVKAEEIIDYTQRENVAEKLAKNKIDSLKNSLESRLSIIGEVRYKIFTDKFKNKSNLFSKVTRFASSGKSFIF